MVNSLDSHPKLLPIPCPPEKLGIFEGQMGKDGLDMKASVPSH